MATYIQVLRFCRVAKGTQLDSCTPTMHCIRIWMCSPVACFASPVFVLQTLHGVFVETDCMFLHF